MLLLKSLKRSRTFSPKNLIRKGNSGIGGHFSFSFKAIFVLSLFLLLTGFNSTNAAVTFVAAGTEAVAANGNVTPAIPAGIQNNDILIAVIHSRDNVNSTMPADWTEKVAGSGNANNHLEVWWKRTTGSESVPTVTHTAGNSIIAKIYAFRGAVEGVDPFNVVGSVQSQTSAFVSTAAITTTANSAMILHIFGSQDDNDWGTFTGLASTLADVIVGNTLGTDNSLGLVYGLHPGLGTTGAAGAEETAREPDASVSVQMALTPMEVVIITEGPKTSIIPTEREWEVFAPKRVIFSGTAYPQSIVKLEKKASPEAGYQDIFDIKSTLYADGQFNILTGGLPKGDHFFGLVAQDFKGHKSRVVSFAVSLQDIDNFEVRDVILPPTAEIIDTVIDLNSNVTVSGYGGQYSAIEITIDNVLKLSQNVKADSSGAYIFSEDTVGLSPGIHYLQVRYRLSSSAIASPFSAPLAFKISPLASHQADFNSDNKIDTVDFSIFLSQWESSDNTVRLKDDFNNDNEINIADFSIFLKSFNNL